MIDWLLVFVSIGSWFPTQGAGGHRCLRRSTQASKGFQVGMRARNLRWKRNHSRNPNTQLKSRGKRPPASWGWPSSRRDSSGRSTQEEGKILMQTIHYVITIYYDHTLCSSYTFTSVVYIYFHVHVSYILGPPLYSLWKTNVWRVGKYLKRAGGPLTPVSTTIFN